MSPWDVGKILRPAIESVPDHRTNWFTKKLATQLLEAGEEQLRIIDPTIPEMEELSGNLNTAVLLVNALCEGKNEEVVSLSIFDSHYLESE